MLALIVKPGAWDLVVEVTFWGEILKAVATAVAILSMKLFMCVFLQLLCQLVYVLIIRQILIEQKIFPPDFFIR